MSQKYKPNHALRLGALLISGFFLAMSTALVAYIHSSFLANVVGTPLVGTVFTVGFVLTIFVVQHYGQLIHRFGNLAVLSYNIVGQALALFVMAQSQRPGFILAAFFVFTILTTTTIINFDLYLKALAKEAVTGRVRGLFWTVINLGFLVSPLITGTLVKLYGFSVVYALAGLLVVPAFITMMLVYHYVDGDVPYRRHEQTRQTLRRMWSNRDMRGVFTIGFVLYFFYACMVIYTPIYLQEAGFTWVQIGKMFTIMLIPFVLIEYPAGWLADNFLGETELFTLGFSIMAVAVFCLMAVDTWLGMTLVLFASRVGASLVEIMRESYFYKKVKASDLDLIDTFRNTSSVAYAITPLFATLFLGLGFNLNALFVVLACVLVGAATIPLTMTDTK